MGLRLAVKEWAGVIHALANGDQILLIRKYEPEKECFLLYPTYNYYIVDKANPERFEKKIQRKFLIAARDAALEELEDPSIVRLKYMFEVDDVINISQHAKLGSIVPFMIWTEKHVASYAEKASSGLNIWIGRTKKLSEPILAARQTLGGSITTYKHFEDFKIDNAVAVQSDNQYQAERTKLINLLHSASK